jgi:hypothetical protein
VRHQGFEAAADVGTGDLQVATLLLQGSCKLRARLMQKLHSLQDEHKSMVSSL